MDVTLPAPSTSAMPGALGRRRRQEATRSCWFSAVTLGCCHTSASNPLSSMESQVEAGNTFTACCGVRVVPPEPSGRGVPSTVRVGKPWRGDRPAATAPSVRLSALMAEMTEYGPPDHSSPRAAVPGGMRLASQALSTHSSAAAVIVVTQRPRTASISPAPRDAHEALDASSSASAAESGACHSSSEDMLARMVLGGWDGFGGAPRGVG
mmetsp:Transcript_16002/g.54352  ORF Transcript_16002/g.54352 Transcript_16002/m.54352 type:complete len:209 (+) Transcript_16002:775-1401(+)